MNNEEMLRFIRGHSHELVFQARRVLVTYRKGQKQSKIAKHQRVRWPDQLSTTERTLKSSRLLLHVIQRASSNSVHLYCATGYKVFGTVDKGKRNLFDNFQKIHEKNSLTVETCIKTHCYTHFSNCSLILVICITLSHAKL